MKIINNIIEKNIILIDNNQFVNKEIKKCITSIGYKLFHLNINNLINDTLIKNKINLIILNVDKISEQLLQNFNKIIEVDIPIIYISKTNNIIIKKIVDDDSYVYLDFPLNKTKFLVTIESAINYYNLKSELENKYNKKTNNNAKEAIIKTNTKNQIIYMNKTAESLTGWKLNDAKGQSINDILHVRKEKKHMTKTLSFNDFLIISQMPEKNDDLYLYSRNGYIIPIIEHVNKIFDEMGNLHGKSYIFKGAIH